MLKLLGMHESELAKLLLPYRSMLHAADGLSRKLDCTIHAPTLQQVLLEKPPLRYVPLSRGSFRMVHGSAAAAGCGSDRGGR